MRRILVSITFLFALCGSTAFATTGQGTGFAAGFGLGINGIDLSDGTVRTNIGGVGMNLNFGFHLLDNFAVLIDGNFMSINLGLTDYVADSDIRLKFYFTENFHLSGFFGLAQFRRTAYSNNLTTVTTSFGGDTGGILGYDIYAGQGQSPFRLSINVGAKRYDFGSQDIRTGNDVIDQDLANHINGLGFFGYLGLDWYL